MRHLTTVAALVLLAGQVFAQAPQPTVPPGPPPVTQPTSAPPVATPGVSLTPAAAAKPATPFVSIVVRDDKGAVKPIGGNPDAAAIDAQTIITAAEREALNGPIAEWAADMNRLVIDHQDIIDRLELEGIVDTLDLDDQSQMILVGKVLAPFSTLGSLSARLSQQGVLKDAALAAVQQSSGEYSNMIFNEVLNAPAVQEVSPLDAQKQQLSTIARFGFYIGYRDAWSQWHSMLFDAAPMLGTLAAADAPAAFKDAAAKAKAAGSDVERINSAKTALRALPMDQRRALLAKAVEQGAGGNLSKPAPYVPHPYIR